MSLVKTLEQIKAVAPLANEDVDSSDHVETLTARRGRKRNAELELQRLREEYAQGLLRSAAFILVTGEGHEEFAEIASSKFNCFSAKPEAVYADLAGRVNPALYGRESTAGLFDVVGRHMEDLADELGILGYPQLQFRQEYAHVVKSPSELTSVLKQAINDQVGSELSGIYAVRSLVDTAIKANHGASVTPIVLSTSDEQLASTLRGDLERLSPYVFLVVAGKASKQMKSAPGAVVLKNSNEESVESALTSIRGSIRK